MRVDLRGRINNLPLRPSDCLLPLMEAVVNGLHAIEARLKAKTAKQGRIEIVIRRSGLPLTEADKKTRKVRSIDGFEVTDNGVGFTDANFEAFETADTTAKAELGGKGIGRLTWLKAFDRAEVSSAFNTGGQRGLRSFVFSIEHGGVGEIGDAGPDFEVGTTVRLRGFKPDFEGPCPRTADVIARRIVEHCIESFVNKAVPQMLLRDEDDAEGKPVDLSAVFSELVQRETSTETLTIRKSRFQVRHLLLRATRDSRPHHVALCAHKRCVVHEPLRDRIPSLPDALDLPELGERVVYAAYVSGSLLDRTVNAERTGFTLPADGDLDFPDSVTRLELLNAVVERAKAHLRPHTSAMADRTVERIRAYVEKRPRFRHLLKHCMDDIRALGADLPDDRLDIELYKIDRKHEIALREAGAEIVSAAGTDDEDYAKTRARLASFIEEANDAGKSVLADYVAHRRVILEVLRRKIGLNSEGKYELEELIHQFVFPMKTDSDEVSYESQNLWLIDERLAYHFYLASDKVLKTLSVVDTPSAERPDLIIFNRPIAVVDTQPPFGSVVIIEFKRPERNDYSDDDNPIEQVYGYIRRVRDGTAKDRTGKTIQVGKAVPFFCYIVCSLTPKLAEYAENAALHPAQDGLGYFGFNERLSAYVEIISFDKLIADASKRNAILFDKLRLPPLR